MKRMVVNYNPRFLAVHSDGRTHHFNRKVELVVSMKTLLLICLSVFLLCMSGKC